MRKLQHGYLSASFAFALVLLFLCVSPASAKSWRVKSYSVSAMPCKHKICWASSEYERGGWQRTRIMHGDLTIAYADGRKLKITTQGNVSSKKIGYFDASPRISADKLTIGWTQGIHKPCTDWSPGGTMFLNSEVVLYRQGKIQRVFKTPNVFIHKWTFWDKDRFVAVLSAYHHGPETAWLFNIGTGKLVKKVIVGSDESKRLKWVEDLVGKEFLR